MQEANIIFKQFDKDNDGKLGFEDVANAFKEIYPKESKLIRDKDMQEIINKADSNGDGYIDISEWHTIAISHRRKLSDSQLRWAFNFFDVDGCGKITLQHFKQALKIPDDQFNEIYWSNLITEVD
jgi:calcium-dependent protein kinase